MSLIACRECEHPVSTRAAACPSCGCPVALGDDERAQWLERMDQEADNVIAALQATQSGIDEALVTATTSETWFYAGSGAALLELAVRLTTRVTGPLGELSPLLDEAMLDIAMDSGCPGVTPVAQVADLLGDCEGRLSDARVSCVEFNDTLTALAELSRPVEVDAADAADDFDLLPTDPPLIDVDEAARHMALIDRTVERIDELSVELHDALSNLHRYMLTRSYVIAGHSVSTE